MGNVTALEMDVITEKSGHTMTGMAVSVCLTPAAPSPLPLPYPTVATVSEGVVDECLRTKIDGAKVLTVGSCTKNCHGNEPGTLKEVMSLTTADQCFPLIGAPVVFIELGMAGITGSLGQMNKNPLPGVGGSASGAGGGGGGGGGANGGAGGPPGAGTQGPSNGSGGGGGSNTGAAPPNPPAPPGADGQAKAGHPVDVVTGTMFTLPAVDIDLRGPLPLQWVRKYMTSSVRRQCGLGFGWSHSFAWRAEETHGEITVVDDDGSPIAFPAIRPDQIFAAPFGRMLSREGDDLVLATNDGTRRVLRRFEPKSYRLVEVRDGSGNATTVMWDDGRIVQLVDCVGRRVVIERHLRTEVLTIVVPGEGGAETRVFGCSYEHDESGNLVRAVDSGGAATEYAYDDEHFLIEERLPNGLVYKFVYADGPDGKRRCVETWGEIPGRDVVAELRGVAGSPSTSPSHNGHSSFPRGVFHCKLEYGPAPFETTVVDATGAVHRYRGNALGLVESYTDPLGRTTTIAYDQQGSVAMVRDALGVALVQQSDRAGRLLRSTDGARRTVQLKRDEHGNVSEVRDYAGARWHMRYDAAGRLIARIDPSGAVTECKYDERGLATETIGPGGKEVYERDAHGNVVTRTSVAGEQWKYAWDGLGLPRRIETPTGCVYDLQVDARGDIVEVDASEGRIAKYAYDGRRHIVAEEHPGGGVTRFRWLADTMVERTGPDDGRYTMGYDAMLRPLWIQNPAGERHRFEYDGAGQLVSEITFAGREIRYEYDAVGRLARTTRDGRSIEHVIDDAGTLRQMRYASGAVEVFDRDERGFVTCARSGEVKVTLERDSAGRVAREIQEVGGWRFVVDHSFDDLGYVVRRRYSTGWTVHAQRGLGGAIEALHVLGRDGAVQEAITLSYGRTETIARQGREDGVAVTKDVWGRPLRTVVKAADGQVRERLHAWTPQLGAQRIEDEAGHRDYELDDLGRAVRVKGLGTDEAFDFSPQGVPVKRGASERVGAGGRKRQIEGAWLEWDASGRLAKRTAAEPAKSWEYRYDDADRLVLATRGDGFWIRYVYDPFGRRLAAVRNDGTSTFYGWDGDQQVEEIGTDGAAQRRVFRDDDYTPLLDSIDGATWRIVAHDLARTPWLYLGKEAIDGTLDLTAYGMEARSEGRPGALRFAGQVRDEDTGLHYNYHRYYAPDIGTFITPDPIGLGGSVGCDIRFVPNVTAWMDPLGLIIVVGSYDEESLQSARMRASATRQSWVRADQLTAGSLAGHDHVELISHGSKEGGYMQFMNGEKPPWKNGRQVGAALNNAGLQPGATVTTIVCNASMQPGGQKRDIRKANNESVVQGINNATGANTHGPSGICYVRPYNQQYCGVCPSPGGGQRGTVDMTTGQWNQATGPQGGPSTMNPNVPPPQPPKGRPGVDYWDGPAAPVGRGSHGWVQDGTHQP